MLLVAFLLFVPSYLTSSIIFHICIIRTTCSIIDCCFLHCVSHMHVILFSLTDVFYVAPLMCMVVSYPWLLFPTLCISYACYSLLIDWCFLCCASHVNGSLISMSVVSYIAPHMCLVFSPWPLLPTLCLSCAWCSLPPMCMVFSLVHLAYSAFASSAVQHCTSY